MFLKIRYSIWDKVYLRCSYFTFGNRLKNINMSVVAYYNYRSKGTRAGEVETLFRASNTWQFQYSLRSRRLEVVDERENGRAQGRQAHFFLCPLLPVQAPVTQASFNKNW